VGGVVFYARDVQEIGIVSGSPPTVRRTEGSQHLFLTFEGLREARNIADKLTRIRVALRTADAQRLYAALGEQLSSAGDSGTHVLR
jgi:hypothetical protein